MSTASDYRALPDRTLNLYLYPLGIWGIATVALWFSQYGQWAIPLCYPLALWQIVLSAAWGTNLLRRLDRGELTNAEAHSGIRSVANLLGGSALLPAIVFLANDPMSPEGWSTAVGAAVVAGLAVGAVSVLTRMSSRWTHAVALALACLALPVNATGAVTVATMLGLYDVVVEVAPVPEELKPPTPDRDEPRPERGKKRSRER